MRLETRHYAPRLTVRHMLTVYRLEIMITVLHQMDVRYSSVSAAGRSYASKTSVSHPYFGRQVGVPYIIAIPKQILTWLKE